MSRCNQDCQQGRHCDCATSLEAVPPTAWCMQTVAGLELSRIRRPGWTPLYTPEQIEAMKELPR